MATNQNIVHADPTKQFFVDYLTRDIGLIDSVLDLIDNSLHCFVRSRGIDVSEMLMKSKAKEKVLKTVIEVHISSDELAIEDNCGGLTRKEAQDEAFMFGRITRQRGYTGLGLYGIGMKRAFFKIGKMIVFTSRAKNEKAYTIPIDVERWKKNRKDWSFPFEDAPSGRQTKAGTTIKITNLNEGVGKRFMLISFQNELIDRISATYALFLRAGIKVYVNGRLVKDNLPEFAYETVNPVRTKFNYNGVNVLIYAGISPSMDTTPRGWYVFCNGRMVIEADKSALTGWGEDFPQFHSKFNHFLGFMYFRSKDPHKLPWTTIKRGINKESSVYQEALTEMKRRARPITKFLADFYPPDSEFEAQLKRDALGQAKQISIYDLPKKETDFEVDLPPKAKPREGRILYYRSRHIIEKVKRTLGNSKITNKEAGERTFDYYVEKECD